MEEKLNTRIASYFTESEESIYQRVLQLNDSAKLDEFYLLLILKKLTARDQLIGFLQSLKKSDSLKLEELVECLWSLSLFLENNPLLKNLHQFIIELNSKGVIERGVLMQKLNDKTLFQCGFFQQQAYGKKQTRIITRMRYEQNKYNLFREANEGYSKVALQLLSLRDLDDVEKVEQSIICLIGNFDLDPDRVIDLILDAFIQNSGMKMYIELLKRFERSSLPPLVCQRLIKIAAESPAEKLVSYESIDFFLAQPLPKLLNQESWTPNLKLLRVVALLIKNGLLKLDEVTNSLSPADAFFETDALRRKEMSKLKYNEAFVFNSEELTDRQKRQLDRAEKIDFFGQFLNSTKLWLMSELADINDWQNFYAMWYMYGMHIDLITHQPILRNLFRLLDWSIDKVYQKISLSRLLKRRTAVNSRGEKQPEYDSNNPIRQIKQIENIGQEFFDQLQDILSVLKGYIGLCGVTYIKICRIFRKLIVNPNIFGVDQSQLLEYRERIREIVRLYLLPGIAAQKCNPSLEIELFQLLTLEHFQFRYGCYLQNLSELMLSNPYFVSQFSRKKKEQNVLFNTLSAEKKKQYFKKIAKLANNHPFCVFYWATKRVMSEAQKQSIPQIVNVLMNCTHLSMDVFVFVMLFSMLENRQPTFNSKMGDMAGWYRNCVVFFGIFYRKHPETDLAPLINYVVGKLSRPIKELVELGEMQSLQLKILKEILTKMAGVVVQEEASRTQLAAGPKMISQLQNISSDSRPTKKSKSELQSYFYERTLNYQHNRSLAFYIMVMITQKRSETIQNSGVMDVKLLADVYDQYTTSLIQFVRMLTLLATDHQQFAKLLPEGSLRQLILTYKVPIELAFHIFRNSIKNTSSMSGDQWARTLKQVSSVMEEVLSENCDLYAQSYRPNRDLLTTMSNYKNKFKKCITYELYSAFWLLNIDCVFYPQSLYDDKIDELKKKISSWRASDKADKELDKTKTLLEKIVKESEAQKRKFQETMEEANKHKILIDRLNDKKSDKTEEFLDTFVEMFSQTCILPRLLLQPKEALYCSKFVLMFVRANQLNSSRSVKLIYFLLQNVISYLQFATHRESLCITIFTTELLSVFVNWNDPDKLKNDFLTKLGTDDSLIKDNLSKMKDYLLNKMFDRIVLYIKSVKEEPYLIKNALYLLDKLEIIPAFKQQAEELEVYMKDLKDRFYSLKDMKPIIDRLISVLTRKKTSLPQRPIVEEKKKDSKPITMTSTTTNNNNSAPSLDGRLPIQPISSTNGSATQSQNNIHPIQTQLPMQQSMIVEPPTLPVQAHQVSTEKHNNRLPPAQQAVSHTTEKTKFERQPFQRINSRQTPLPSKEQNTQPPKESQRQFKQRQRELKFSNPNQQVAAIPSNTPTLNKDIEKGQITTTPTPSNQTYVPPGEPLVAPAKLRTVKQVKQQQNKQKYAAKNIAAQTVTVLPTAPRLESKITGLQQGQNSQGEIPTTKETDRRDKDRDRESRQSKNKDHTNYKDREREHNKDRQDKSDKGITNKEHPKNELHNIAKRIREKNPNPIPFKDQPSIDNTKSVNLTQESGTSKQEPIISSQQPLTNSNTVSTINPERQSKQSTNNLARRDDRDRKDERRNDKDDRDRKEYDKSNDRHDKKYYDHHRDSRDNRRRSGSKNRNRR